MRTLIAAITEMLLTTENFVLVCAHSNAACDELTKRLLEVVPDGSLFRLYAKSFKVSALSESVKRSSNLVDNEFKFPSLTYLYKFRIVVCTFLTAGPAELAV